MDIINVIPIPKSIPENIFTSYSNTVNKPIKYDTTNFNHTGTYKIKCSSYATNYPAYNAFNRDNNFWKCSNEKNTFFSQDCKINTYSSNSYKNYKYGNSSFQGGSNNAKWVTNVGIFGQNKIYGEWIQIEIPNSQKIYLYSYSILTPKPSNNILTFPTKFMVVGSNDEKIWEYIDLQNIKQPINTSSGESKKFNVNSTKPFSYYRLIIMEMPPNNSDIKIIQWDLNFMPYLSLNFDAFTDYNQEISDQYNTVENKYAKYNTSSPLHLNNNDSFIEKEYHMNDMKYDSILPLVCTIILAITILFYRKNN